MIFTSLCSYRYLVSPVQSFYTRMPDPHMVLTPKESPDKQLLISIAYGIKVNQDIFLNNSVLSLPYAIYSRLFFGAGEHIQNILHGLICAHTIDCLPHDLHCLLTHPGSSSRSSLLVPDFHDIDCREHTLFRKFAVEHEFHVTGSLKLLEHNVVHLASGIYQRCRKDR